MHRRPILARALVATLALAGCQTGAEPGAAPAAAGSAAAASLPEPAAGAGAVDGRYLGYARLPGPARLAAALDLVAVRTPPGRPAYRAILKLAPGGFASHEYAAVYFPDVRFAPATQALTFAAGTGDVTLSAATLKDGVLRATATSRNDHASVELELRAGLNSEAQAQTAVFPGLPAVPAVTGTYRGRCAGGPTGLQLEASKWRGTRPDGGLFASYRLTGRLSEATVGCGIGETCVKESYTSGVLNLLTGELALKSTAAKRPVACVLLAGVARCGECTLTRDEAVTHAVVDAARTYRRHARAEHLPAAPAPARQPERAGQYYGWLHHEARDVYQLVALNVKAGDAKPGAPAADDGGAVATLYFGEGDSSEFIAYQLKDSALAAAEGAQPGSVLEGGGEAFLVVDGWRDGVVRGTWYSKAFGRVGTVELQRDVVPAFAHDAEALERVAGVYRGDDWDFELAAAAGVSDDAFDFYPLKLFGLARERLKGAHNRAIDDGTYDFYTGSFAFRLDDGRLVIGRVTAGGMQLAWPPKPRLGTPLTDAPSQLFKRQTDTFQAVAPTLHRW